MVERFFNKIKHCRRVATRYDKLAANYLAFVKLACIRLWLHVYEFRTRSAATASNWGRVGDVLIVLLKHFRPQEPLKEDEEKAITALRAMLDEIANVKENHNRQAIRPSWGTFPTVSDKPLRRKSRRR